MGCRQRDLSDRANLLLDWASTGRLREASLPGRPHSIRDPTGPADASAAERRGPQMNSAAPFLKGRLTYVRLAIVLETATTAGALNGVLLAGVIRASYLFFVFAMILLLSA